eukprot:4110118-Prymnesium_polylepis.1
MDTRHCPRTDGALAHRGFCRPHGEIFPPVEASLAPCKAGLRAIDSGPDAPNVDQALHVGGRRQSVAVSEKVYWRRSLAPFLHDIDGEEATGRQCARSWQAPRVVIKPRMHVVARLDGTKRVARPVIGAAQRKPRHLDAVGQPRVVALPLRTD